MADPRCGSLSSAVFDAIWLSIYVLGFWRFVLSPKFRAETYSRWENATLGQEVGLLIEAVVALIFGVLGPVALLLFILRMT